MPSVAKRPQVFIAFAEPDTPWVKGLIPFLKAHDIEVTSELDFLVGEQKAERVSQAISTADHLLLVISPEAMADPWVEATRDATIARALQLRQQRAVLPVFVHPAPLPALLSGVAHCKLTDREEAAYRSALLRLVKGVRGKDAELKPGMALPAMPESWPLAGLWETLVGVYGSLTRDIFKRTWLGGRGMKAGRLDSFDLLDPLEPALAANLYLTTFGSRQDRAAPILADLEALKRELRTAPKYDLVVKEIETLLKQSSEAAHAAGKSEPSTAYRLAAPDRRHLRKVLSTHLKEEARRLIWADLELEPGRLPEAKTLEDRWHATLDAVASQGRERFRLMLTMAVERAQVLADDPVVCRLLALDDEALKAYLTATLHHHRSLPLLGVNPELKLTLGIDDVYVPLEARIYRSIYHNEAGCAEQLEKTTRRKRSQAGMPEELAPVETDLDLTRAFATAAEQKKRGVVILGDPGSGKTTLMKLLLVRCIQDGAASLGLPADVIPVMLPLRDLEDTDSSLAEFCQRSLQANQHLELPSGFAKALSRKRPILYLLDGLDEVPDETRRADVSHWIQRAIETYDHAWFAVSSRYAGYKGATRLDDHFLELNIRPLEEPEAKSLVERFYTIVERYLLGDTNSAKISAEEKSTALWSLLAAETYRTRRMRELQTNPLLLTILCLVHQRYNDLPDRRWRLYEQCVDTLLWHWRKAVGLEMPFPLEDSRKLLLPFARWLHQKDNRRQATADEVVTALEEQLRQIAVNPDRFKEFLKAVRDRSGLLVGWGADSYGFIHLAFQEFLTAIELKNRAFGKLEVLDEAAAHFGESWWTEVILLLVSLPEPSMFEPFMRRLVREDRFARPEHRQLVSDCVADASVRSPLPFLEVASDDKRGAEVHLAALQAIRGMGDEHKGKVIETCHHLLAHSPHPKVKDLARELLAARGVAIDKPLEAGDPWVHDATGLQFVWVPPGSFMMGGNGEYDGKPIHKVTFAQGFWIGKYPVTNAQYARFMKLGKGREPDYWKESQFNAAEQPVVGVTWEDAFAYCRWASEVLLEGEKQPPSGASILLPSEAEWEYAARGPENREYPWGNKKPTPKRANFDESGIRRTAPVGQYPDGASWVGALDMAGNAWEWCADVWNDSHEGAPDDGSPRATGSDMARRVIRGGSWLNGAVWVRSAYRYWRPFGLRSRDLGFRVLLAALPTGSLDAIDS